MHVQYPVDYKLESVDMIVVVAIHADKEQGKSCTIAVQARQSH